MSQRKEKYARRVERRVDKLEAEVEKIHGDSVEHRSRLSLVEGELAVYHAAKAHRAEQERREAEWKASKYKRLCEKRRRQQVLLLRFVVSGMAMLLFFIAMISCLL